MLFTLHCTDREMNELPFTTCQFNWAIDATVQAPAEWPARAGFEALRETAEDLRRRELEDRLLAAALR